MNLEHLKGKVFVLSLLSALLASHLRAAPFPNYFPTNTADHGIKTFRWTYGRTGSYTSQIGSTESIPYTSGSIQGTYITNWSDWGDTLVANDGASVKIFGNATHYLSSDPFLTSHPSSWTFTDVTDGLVVDQRGTYFVPKDLSSAELDDSQLVFFELQDISVLNGTYNDAIVMWYLDSDYSYVVPNFQSTDTALGLSVSGDLASLGYSITAFDIYGSGTGIIATGDIDASTGTLDELAELSKVSPVPLPSSVVLVVCGLVGALPRLKRRRAPRLQ